VAQAQPQYWWTGVAANQKAKPDVWGNGAVAPTTELTYNGNPVLKLTTRNPHEGVRLDFATPVDLTPLMDTAILRLRLRFHDAPPPPAPAATDLLPGGVNPAGVPGVAPDAAVAGALPPLATAGNTPAGMPVTRGNQQLAPRLAQLGPLPAIGAPNTGAQTGALPGANAGGGFPTLPVTGDVAPTMPAGPPAQQTPIKRIILTLQLQRGIGELDLPINLEQTTPDEDGWRLFDIPLKNLRLSPNAGGPARRVIITSDQEDSFYLAELGVLTDTESGRMSVSIRRPTDPVGTQIAEITVRPGPLTLVADVASGTADPVIEWNFDADNLGILPAPALGAPGGRRIDVRGAVAKFEYPNEEQNFRVEVTVRDRLNRKPTVTASLLVKVRG
jgi:hypothetical protein